MDMDSGSVQRASDGGLRVSGHRLLPSLSIPADWGRMLRVHDLLGDITISCWNGQPGADLDVEANGPAMFCIGVFLAGEARMALDGGPLLTVTSGMAVIQTANRPSVGRFAMKGGTPIRLVDIRFTPQGLLHAGGRPLMALQGQFLQDCSLPLADSLLGGFPAPAALLRVATDILACEYEDEAIRGLYLRAKALEALALALNTVSQPAETRVMSRERRQLMAARSLLDERYAEDWTLDRLARAVGLNEKKLQAGFRVIAGRSVHGHLREVRLAAAAAMLSSGASVTETAYAVGFSSLSHFSKAFRETMGAAPREWAQARRS